MIMIQKRGAKKMKRIDVEKLSGLVREHTLSELRENRIGGKEVIVHQNGKCVYHETFGTACAGGQAQAKPLIYRAASMTKPITAAPTDSAAVMATETIFPFSRTAYIRALPWRSR